MDLNPTVKNNVLQLLYKDFADNDMKVRDEVKSFEGGLQRICNERGMGKIYKEKRRRT